MRQLKTDGASLPASLAAHGVMVQPYLNTIETWGEASAIWLDNQIVYTVLKRPAKDDFRVQRQFGGTETIHEPGAIELSFVKNVINALPQTPLFARVDYTIDEERGLPVLVEVELIEPRLFFDLYPDGASILASAVANRI
jgi:hypothetical protein